MIELEALLSSLKTHTLEEIRRVSDERVENIIEGKRVPLSAAEAERLELSLYSYPHGAFTRLCAVLYAQSGMNPRTALTRALVEANRFETHDHITSLVLKHPKVHEASGDIQVEYRLAKGTPVGNRRQGVLSHQNVVVTVGETRKPNAMKDLVRVMVSEFFRREPFSHFNTTTTFKNNLSGETLTATQLLRHIEGKVMCEHFQLIVDDKALRVQTTTPALHNLGAEIWEHAGGGHLSAID